MKTLLITGVASVTVLSAAACGGSSKPAGTNATKASYIGVPAVTLRQPFKYQVPGAEGSLDLELTVLSVKQKPGTDSDPEHSVTLCLNVKVRNVRTTWFVFDDSDALTSGKWFGRVGQQADARPATMGSCSPSGTE